MGSPVTQPFSEAFSTRDLARAIRRSHDEIEAWVEAGAIRTLPVGDGRTWISRTEALRAGRALVDGSLMASAAFVRAHQPAELFESTARTGWRGIRPLAVSSSLHAGLIAATVSLSLLGVVTFGTLAGSMLPFLLRWLGFDPASASAPFVATLVDVTGLVIYFTVASIILRGTLL